MVTTERAVDLLDAGETGAGRLPVDQHGAGAAIASIAADFRSA